MAPHPKQAARRSATCESGATLVEAAVGLTVLLMMVVGVMQMALALYTYHYTSHAAREGTRYAIVRGSSSCATLTTPCNVNSAAIQSYLRGLPTPGIKSSLISVTATWPSTLNCTPSATPCNNPTNLVKVTVTYPFPFAAPFITSATVNLSSTSEMVISQ